MRGAGDRRGVDRAPPPLGRPAAPVGRPAAPVGRPALLPDVRAVLAPLDSPRLQALSAELGEHAANAALLAEALVPQPPVLARDGGIFADGFDA